MGRKSFYCCSVRIGVIFIGSLSIVMALLGLVALCMTANRLTLILLTPPVEPSAQHSPTPTPDPDAEFVRVPRDSAARVAHLWTMPQHPVDATIERYSRMLLQGMDSISSPPTDEGSTKVTNHNASDIKGNQSETGRKIDSLNGSEESNADRRSQVEVETGTRSSQKDPFAETTTEVNGKSKQPAGDENSANSFDSPQRISKPTSTQRSTETTTNRDSLDISSGNSLDGSPRRRIDGESTGRELEEEEGSPEDKNRESPLCGGQELEDLMFKVAFLSAYDAVDQTRVQMARRQGSIALGAALYAGGLGAILFGAIFEVLHIGAGALLIYGAVKGRGELLWPWRLLAVASWAMSVGGHAVTLAAFHPLRAGDPAEDAVGVAGLAFGLAIYAYCYSVVLNLERELHTKKQKSRPDSNEAEEKEHRNIYSWRF